MFVSMKQFFNKVCVSMMMLVMFGLNLQMPVAEAAMVGTDQIIRQQLHGR